MMRVLVSVIQPTGKRAASERDLLGGNVLGRAMAAFGRSAGPSRPGCGILVSDLGTAENDLLSRIRDVLAPKR